MNKKSKNTWIVKIVILSIIISVVFTFASEAALGDTGYIVALLVLILFVAIGVLFDIIGLAVTSASETPFHSMASHKTKGAAEAIKLIKNADKVSSVCNDVVGDISGIVSGTTSALIVSMLVTDFGLSQVVMQLVCSGLVAGCTIGGKALGKSVAINNSTKIVLAVGRIICFCKGIFKKK